ncbi:MAG: tetratricopeptide repeat protein [Patescibacteria group bacterium]
MPIVKTNSIKNMTTTIYQKIVRTCLYLAVFLIPIFFLPITSEYLEFSKTLLFYLLTLVAAVFWLLDLALKKEKKAWLSPLGLPVLIFGILFLIATIFSYQLDYSLLGLPSYYHHSLLSIVLFIIFFFVVINNVVNIAQIKKIIGFFLASPGMAAIFGFLQLFKAYLLPWAGTKSVNFNLISNSINGFSVYLALIFLTSFIFLLLTQEKWLKIVLSVYSAAVLVLILLMDIQAGLSALIVGGAFLLFFLTVKARDISPKWTVIIALVLALAVIFSFIDVSGWHDFGLQKDVVLDQGTSLEITKENISKNFLFGSGPSTFYYGLVRFRPVSFNNTAYWNFSFIKASNEWGQVLNTAGVLGFIGFTGLFIYFLIRLLRDFYRKKLNGSEGFFYLLFISITALIFFSGIFTTYSFVLMFFLILFLALGTVLLRTPARKEKPVKTGQTNVFSSLGLSLVIIFAIVILYFSGRMLLADYYYNKATELVNKNADLAQVEDNLKKAVDLFGRNVNYNFSLAQNFLVRAQLASQGSQPDSNLIQSQVSQAVFYGQKGLDLAKKDPAAYLAMAGIYQYLSLISQEDIGQLIVDNYQKAVELDENNPQIYYQLGNYYATAGLSYLNTLSSAKEEDKEGITAQAQDLLDSALSNFEKAMSLKQNYALAEASWALTYEIKGDTDRAIAEMSKLTEKYPSDFSLFYELGRMYLNQENYDLALVNFQKVLALYPNYSNAHWQLSAIYEKQGKKDLAIKEMETVLELNPGNDSVQARLDELKK